MFCFIPSWLPVAVNKVDRSPCSQRRLRSYVNKVMCLTCQLPVCLGINTSWKPTSVLFDLLTVSLACFTCWLLYKSVFQFCNFPAGPGDVSTFMFGVCHPACDFIVRVQLLPSEAVDDKLSYVFFPIWRFSSVLVLFWLTPQPHCLKQFVALVESFKCVMFYSQVVVRPQLLCGFPRLACWVTLAIQAIVISLIG